MAIQELIKNPPVFKAKETINPATFTTITLDDISVKLSKLINIETSNKQQNQKLLTDNQTLLSSILKELQDDADEGEVLSINGTAQSNDFTFIETITAPGHPVKGYAVINDEPTTGGNAIFVAHNTTKAGLQPDLSDVTSSLTRFRRVNPGEEVRFIFNRKRIYNVSILAQTGTAAIRAWLVW